MASDLTDNNSLPPASGDQNTPKPKRVLYFINERVEDLIRKYLWTGCTKVALRDQIMDNAPELIRQIIRKQGLHTIYTGQEESSFGDLVQVAWTQIERVIYKFRAKPHCRTCYNPDRPSDSLLYDPPILEYGIITYDRLFEIGITSCPKCNTKLSAEPEVVAEQDTYGGSTTILFRGPSKVFNMWSQVSRTVILAHIKKEGRDRKNSNQYRDFVDNRHRPNCDMINRFLAEARELAQYNDDHLRIINSLEFIAANDEKPHDGIIGKLVEHSGLSRAVVTNFMQMLRLRCDEFSDAPINRASEMKVNRRFRGGDDRDEND